MVSMLSLVLSWIAVHSLLYRSIWKHNNSNNSYFYHVEGFSYCRRRTTPSMNDNYYINNEKILSKLLRRTMEESKKEKSALKMKMMNSYEDNDDDDYGVEFYEDEYFLLDMEEEEYEESNESKVIKSDMEQKKDDDNSSNDNMPIIDQEGREWRSPSELKQWKRDGLMNGNMMDNLPWQASMSQHSIMLRDTHENKKGRFIADEERWLQRYDALCQFYQKYGHTNVPFFSSSLLHSSTTTSTSSSTEDYDPTHEDNITYKDYMPAYVRMELGYWVAQQRYYYSHKTYNVTRLTPSRVAYLNKLNFTWDLAQSKWDLRYHQLCQFYQKYNHTSVKHNTPLGRWVYKQRYHNLQILQKKTIDLANIPPSALHLYYSSHDTQNSIYNYYSNHNTTQTNYNNNNNRNMIFDFENFVIPVSGGGRLYNGTLISPLTPKRRALLNQINFSWEHHYQSSWDSQYQKLKQFVSKHNHTRPSPTDYPSLAKWVRKQRADYRQLLNRQHNNDDNNNVSSDLILLMETNSHNMAGVTLTKERIEKLNDLNFQWIVRKFTWEDHYEHLKHYKQQFGHANPPQSYHDELYHPKLGAWVTSQRATARKFYNHQNRIITTSGNDDNNKKYEMYHLRYQKLLQLGVYLDAKFHKFKIKYEKVIKYPSDKWDTSTKKWMRSLQKEYQSFCNDNEGSLVSKAKERTYKNRKYSLSAQQINLLNETHFLSIMDTLSK